MIKIDIKSLAAGVIIGTLGVTTVFAAAGIKSAVLSDTQLMLKGESLPLSRSFISVTMDNEETASLYAPVDELLEALGYTVHYDSEKNTIDLIPGVASSQEVIGDVSSDGNAVLNLSNHTDQKNIAESGSFQAEDNQTLTLHITSDIKGGTVDLFLFDPNGTTRRITIGSEDEPVIKEVPLTKGVWHYNCSGIFKDGGSIKIVGTVK